MAEASTATPPVEVATGASVEEPAPLLEWLIACERCGADRRLASYAPPFWYCELNPDPDAERCQPTPDVPLRTHKVGNKTVRTAAAAPLGGAIGSAHAEEMLEIFSRFKREGIEREVTMSSGWVAVFKKRKRGEGTCIAIRTCILDPAFRALTGCCVRHP